MRASPSSAAGVYDPHSHRAGLSAAAGGGGGGGGAPASGSVTSRQAQPAPPKKAA